MTYLKGVRPTLECSRFGGVDLHLYLDLGLQQQIELMTKIETQTTFKIIHGTKTRQRKDKQQEKTLPYQILI